MHHENPMHRGFANPDFIVVGVIAVAAGTFVGWLCFGQFSANIAAIGGIGTGLSVFVLLTWLAYRTDRHAPEVPNQEVNMKVFISSTVFDLLDTRAEIAEVLRSAGISVLLSDDKLSDFAVQHGVNSIETCLVNVDACDEMIVILDKRYGPRLGKHGFENVSATHLEYRRAIEKKKQIHFFVRDRLEADFAIWKKNGKRTDIEYAWVAEKDLGLFDFLEERRALSADKSKPNWLSFFATLTDLKATVASFYDEAQLPHRLADAIYNNTLPLFEFDVDTEEQRGYVKARLKLTNVGSTTALNALVYTDDEAKKNKPGFKGFIHPKSEYSRVCLVPIPCNGPEMSLYVEYDTMIGVAVKDHFVYSVTVSHGTILSRQELRKREFIRGAKPVFKISERYW